MLSPAQHCSHLSNTVIPLPSCHTTIHNGGHEQSPTLSSRPPMRHAHPDVVHATSVIYTHLKIGTAKAGSARSIVTLRTSSACERSYPAASAILRSTKLRHRHGRARVCRYPRCRVSANPSPAGNALELSNGSCCVPYRQAVLRRLRLEAV